MIRIDTYLLKTTYISYPSNQKHLRVTFPRYETTLSNKRPSNSQIFYLRLILQICADRHQSYPAVSRNNMQIIRISRNINSAAILLLEGKDQTRRVSVVSNMVDWSSSIRVNHLKLNGCGCGNQNL